MRFTKVASDINSNARCGVLQSDHGQIETPIFMPVGTVGSVKGVYHRDLKEDIKAQLFWGILIIFIFVRDLILLEQRVDCINLSVGIGRYLPIVAVFKFFL